MGDIVDFPGNKETDEELLIAALDTYIDGLLGYAEILSDDDHNIKLKELISDIVAMQIYAVHKIQPQIEAKINAFRGKYDV